MVTFSSHTVTEQPTQPAYPRRKRWHARARHAFQLYSCTKLLVKTTGSTHSRPASDRERRHLPRMPQSKTAPAKPPTSPHPTQCGSATTKNHVIGGIDPFTMAPWPGGPPNDTSHPPFAVSFSVGATSLNAWTSLPDAQKRYVTVYMVWDKPAG